MIPQRKRDDAPAIDLGAAAKFLRWLDHGAKEFSFQTWPERKEDKGDKSFVRQRHGSLDEYADELTALNARGAAVAVTMNQTDLVGTKRENIVRVRALALDLDGAPLDPVNECKLAPHRVIETSPGRYHVYWLIENGAGIVLNEFEDIQRAIAERFGGDPDVAKLTHRARLPGFFHNKHEPHQVHSTSRSDHDAFDWDAICAEFPPTKKKVYLPGAGSLRNTEDRIILPAGAPVVAAEEFIRHCRSNGDPQTINRKNQSFWNGRLYVGVTLSATGEEMWERLLAEKGQR